MPVLDTLYGNILRRSIVAGTVRVGRDRERINALNVFPVPDGDTGTNMYLTFLSAARAALHQRHGSVADVAGAAAAGALLGARGNSGVILSQFFQGFSEGLAGRATADMALLAEALAEGYRKAASAVGRPVEGTILTVMRRSAAAARLAVDREEGLEQALSIILAETRLAVEETPLQLEILRDAGVVDAGGQGFLSFLEGIWALIRREKLGRLLPIAGIPVKGGNRRYDEALEYRYCTEFLLQAHGLDASEAGRALAPMGGSLLTAGDGDIIKVHIHTNEPGRVLEWATSQGSLDGIKIDNMEKQSAGYFAERSAVQEESSAGTGVVAVLSGEGLWRLFNSLGVMRIVSGGQTMNPSVEDLLQAVEGLPCKDIIVLPNNRNIIMAARRLADLSSKSIRVIPATDAARGVAAMLAFNPQIDAAANESAMTAAMAAVSTGEVTRATRSVVIEGIRVRKDDYIGLVDDRILLSDRHPEDVVSGLLASFKPGWGLATLYYGEDIGAARAKDVAEVIREHFPGAEVELVDGGQPHYHFLLAAE